MEKVKKLTILSEIKLSNLKKYVKKCRYLWGAMAEVGVYRGGSCKLIAETNPDKTIYAYDSFEGLSNVGENDNFSESLFKNVKYPDVVEYLKENKNVVIRKGYFPDTIESEILDVFCFVHFDGDSYQTCIDTMEFFYPRLIKGGVMILDDYKSKWCPGIDTAIKEYAGIIGLEIKVEILTQGQGLIIK